MSTQTQDHSGQNKSFFSSFTISIVSALLIALLAIPFYSTNCNEMGCLVPFFMSMGVQAVMFIPTTLIINFLYDRKARQNNDHVIEPVIRVGILLIITIVAINISQFFAIFLGTFLGFTLFIAISVIPFIWALNKSK